MEITRPAQSDMPASKRFVETSLVRKKLRAEKTAHWFCFGMVILMILPLVSLVTYVFIHAAPSLNLEFFLEVPKKGMTQGGIWPALVGTVYLVLVALAISAPVGVMAAIYLNEYAKDNWFHRTINLAVINLAGVPSIVHALFGLGAFVYAAKFGYSIISASLTLAIMTMPVVITSTREALKAVPMAFREACWNTGATNWQTIHRIVLPNSISGILTGVILEVSRTAGETAPIMFTGAVFYKAVEKGDLFPYFLDEQCMALSMHLFAISTQVPNVEESMKFATAITLLGLVLAINATSITLRMWLRSQKKW